MSDRVKEILALLERCTEEQRKAVFAELRKTIPFHPIEKRLKVSAERILEAVNRNDEGLTFRMIRGVIADLAFETDVIRKLNGWTSTTPKGDLPYDYLLDDEKGSVKVQVKLQRSEKGQLMRGNPKARKYKLPSDMWVVETQKTRGGTNAEGSKTRPYRFGEFDILAVSMQPSTDDWSKFMYVVGNKLLPDPDDSACLLTLQPVAMKPNELWTDNFEECVARLRTKE